MCCIGNGGQQFSLYQVQVKQNICGSPSSILHPSDRHQNHKSRPVCYGNSLMIFQFKFQPMLSTAYLLIYINPCSYTKTEISFIQEVAYVTLGWSICWRPNVSCTLSLYNFYGHPLCKLSHNSLYYLTYFRTKSEKSLLDFPATLNSKSLIVQIN